MLTKAEYESVKQHNMEYALSIIKCIDESKDPCIKYKDSRPITDLKHMIETSCEKYADNVAFMVKDKRGGAYRDIKYRELLEIVNALGTALIECGLRGKKVAIIGENSYKWATSYLATVCGVGVVVPLDRALSHSELEHFIKTSEASGVIFDKKYEKIFKDMKASKETELETLINMDLQESNEDVISWKELVEKGKSLVKAGDRRFIDAQIMNDEMSILLFTSGTTGQSKGVMLSHKNISMDLMVAPTCFEVRANDVFLSFLPIHHTYECTCGFLMPLYKGAAIAYCEGLKYIVKNLSEAKPTVFLGVPILFENLYKKIWSTARKNGKENTLRKALKINGKTKKFGLDLGNFLFKDIKKLFGGRMRMLVCGGAAINPEILDGFRAFGINALQGYGLTECSPMAALNPDTAPRSLSIGKILPGIHVKILNANEEGIGEICVKGANVMLGYYQRPDLTAEVIKDGWFHTGDLGYIDKEGYVYITGRQKNVIIAKNGKNIYPEELENYIANIPFVKESMVWGREKENDQSDTIIVATIRIDENAAKDLFDKNVSDAEIEKALWEEIEKINEELPFFKKIKDIIIRKEDFEKNTSQKIKRFVEANRR